MKISENTSISMPMRNLLSIIGAVAVGAWFGFGVIERLNVIETELQLMNADLLKAAVQKPIDQEQYMLLEFISKEHDKLKKDIEAKLPLIDKVDIDDIIEIQFDINCKSYTDKKGQSKWFTNLICKELRVAYQDIDEDNNNNDIF